MSFPSWLQSLRSALAPGRGRRHHRRRGPLSRDASAPTSKSWKTACVLSFTPGNVYFNGCTPVRR